MGVRDELSVSEERIILSINGVADRDAHLLSERSRVCLCVRLYSEGRVSG